MSDLVTLVGRLRAFDAGRAVRAASHLQVVIQPHALIIAPLAMAGEDTTIHAMAVGPIGGPPQIREEEVTTPSVRAEKDSERKRREEEERQRQDYERKRHEEEEEKRRREEQDDDNGDQTGPIWKNR